MEILKLKNKTDYNTEKIESISCGTDKNGSPVLALIGPNNETVISLTFVEIIQLIEMSVKHLNLSNNNVQQHIRSNKDKENQRISENLDRAYRSLITSKKAIQEGLTSNKHSLDTLLLEEYDAKMTLLKNIKNVRI